MQGRDAEENRAAAPTLVYGHLELTIYSKLAVCMELEHCEEHKDVAMRAVIIYRVLTCVSSPSQLWT
ncbi:hypothetical protein Y032_0346g3132 [Ancylostoma ceylanicum]|uniref:Uncharacterized protein n=1 Tax=Ancylostoma ceylanicum TaxID=53326 RepID=A0A016RY78_9BILA|nr:hypothetical protein Y032_0346g3132 [Ancylostoma ceylanicum]